MRLRRLLATTPTIGRLVSRFLRLFPNARHRTTTLPFALYMGKDHNSARDGIAKPATKGHASYLPHLDGLRAVALAGVLLFHFEVSGFSGGFVGVDCFLVLSGFLISRNIIRAITNGTFTFRDFYMRRFWRLYPASFATGVVALVWSFLSFPSDLAVATIKSALASMMLVSNFQFLREADYFDGEAVFKPLLHTWSLSLEEQFYMFWPVLLYLALRKRSKYSGVLSAAVMVVCALSFLLGLKLHNQHPSFVFFMLPCRLYEFGLGALCAMTERHWQGPDMSSKSQFVLRNLTSAISLVVICASYFLMPQHNTPLHILPVILATSAVICTPDSLIGTNILSNRILRYIGGLTYSAYLTHWVLFVFVRHISKGLELTMPSVLSLTVATFGSGWILQRFVEDPIRKAPKKKVSTTISFILAVFILCFWGLATKGWDFRIAGTEIGRIHYMIVDQYRNDCVDLDDGFTRPKGTAYNCIVGSPADPSSNVLILGDSYARHLIPAFKKIAAENGQTFNFNFYIGCEFVSLRDPRLKALRKECIEFSKTRWRLLRSDPDKHIDPFGRNLTVLMQTYSEYSSKEARHNTTQLLDEDLRALGHHLVVGGQPPGMSDKEKWRFSCMDLKRAPLLRVVEIAVGSRYSVCVQPWMEPRGRSYREWVQSKEVYNDGQLDIQYLDVYGAMCKEEKSKRRLCRTPVDFSEGSADILDLGYARDGHHLTAAGSAEMAALYKRELRL